MLIYIVSLINIYYHMSPSRPADWNHMEEFCGGVAGQAASGGACGVCGDACHGQKQNQDGGIYDSGQYS